MYLLYIVRYIMNSKAEIIELKQKIEQQTLKRGGKSKKKTRKNKGNKY